MTIVIFNKNNDDDDGDDDDDDDNNNNNKNNNINNNNNMYPPPNVTLYYCFRGVVLEDYLFSATQADTNGKVPLTSYDSKEDP